MGKLTTTLLLQVLKVLGDDTLKSGAMATQQNTDNKELYESIEGELQVISLQRRMSLAWPSNLQSKRKFRYQSNLVN